MKMKIRLSQIKTIELEKVIVPKKDDKEAIVFEKDENSYIMGACKESSQEFFEKIYDESGPFWRLYENAGFAINPGNDKYAFYIGNNLYFRKKIEERYINNSGMENFYEIKNNCLMKNAKWDLRNVLYLLSSPFDEMRKFVNIIKFSFYANEMIRGYERLCRSAMEFHSFYSNQENIYDPAKTARESMDRAVEIMEYSIASFICGKYGIRLRKSKYIDECELEKLSMYIETKNEKAILNEFGFYALNPYDISSPRIIDSRFEIEKYSGFNVPVDRSLRWRENVKFIVARYMHIMRMCYLQLGRNSNIGDMIFFLKTNELSGTGIYKENSNENMASVAKRRWEKYEKIKNLIMPEVLVYKNDKYYEIKKEVLKKTPDRNFRGLSVASQESVSGQIININGHEDYSKFFEGSIILTRTLSPNLVVLYKKAVGVISENGGALSHAAIIAREMNLPCIVQARIEGGIKDGQTVKLDGKDGSITFIDDKKRINKEAMYDEMSNVIEYAEGNIMNNVKTNEDKIVLNKDPNNDLSVLGKGKLRSSDAGNKAANLSEIFKQFNVPDGFVIDSGYFKKVIGFSKIKTFISEINNTDKSDYSMLEDHYKKLKGEMLNVAFSRKLINEIGIRYNELSSKVVAARSSSSCEDSAKASFAGQFDSYINIRDMSGLEYAIKNCWASFYSPRSIIYRKEKKIQDESANMAILVQSMINAKYSGIAFSKDIMNNDAISIEAIPGTCEKLASGEAVPNIYAIEREGLSVLKVNANFDFDDNLIINIANEVLKLEKYFNSPQDVEWCIDENNKLWIIQTRPITSACNLK